MKLVNLLCILRADEVVHVIEGDVTVFFGTVRNAFSEIADNILCNKKVLEVFSGFGGLCIDLYE